MAHCGGEWVDGLGKDNLAIHMYLIHNIIHNLFEKDDKLQLFNDSTQPVKLYNFKQTNDLGIPLDKILVT